MVENRTGAGGGLAAQAVKLVPADGYTLMMTISTTMLINRVMYRTLPYDADNATPNDLVKQLNLIPGVTTKIGSDDAVGRRYSVLDAGHSIHQAEMPTLTTRRSCAKSGDVRFRAVLLAPREISRRRSNLVALGAKRTLSGSRWPPKL